MRYFCQSVLAALLIVSAAPFHAVSAKDDMTKSKQDTLSVQRIFDDPNLSGLSPRGVRLSPDGRYVTYLKGKEDNALRADLWAYDIAADKNRLLVDSDGFDTSGAELSEVEKARRERQRINVGGIVEYSWDADGQAILVPLDGDLFYAELQDDGVKTRRLTKTQSYETDARLSPEGGYVSFIRDQNLWAMDIEKGRERQLTKDGGGAILNGMAEFVADEEMDRHTGYWWAPDDSAIAFIRVDESMVPLIRRYDLDADGVKTVEQRYPYAGANNAHVRLGVVSLKTGRTQWIDLGKEQDIYLTRVHWTPDSQALYVQRQSRDQKTLDLLRADRKTGKSKTVLTETAKTWINLNNDMHFLEKGGKFIWGSERDGFHHLYLYRADGTLEKQLTKGDWPITGLEAVDEAKGQIYFSGLKDTPLEQHLYRLDMKNGAVTRLTAPGYWHDISMGDDPQAFLDTRSNPDQPPQIGLYGLDGALKHWVEENRLDDRHPYAPYLASHETPDFGTLKADDGAALYYSMLKPKDFDPKKRYPVIVQVYGGPGVQRVRHQWGSLLDQVMADRGYILFKLDNRGGLNRGKAFEDVLYHRMAKYEVEDQMAGVAFLKSLPYVDGDRIGVTGWSYGGYMTLMLMMQRPEAFAAGISGAPVTEWTLYDTHYTERYMGRPQDNPEGYQASSVFAYADQLKRPMMLIHGMADDNVVFEHATKLFAYFQKNDIPFEMMTYPGQKHSFHGKGQETHRAQVMLDFFGRYLKPGK